VCTTSGDIVHGARVTATVLTRSSAPVPGEPETVDIVGIHLAGHATRRIAQSMDARNGSMRGPGGASEDVAPSASASQERAATQSPMDLSPRLIVTGLVAAGLRDRSQDAVRRAAKLPECPRQFGVVVIGESSASAIERGAKIVAIPGQSLGRRSVHGSVVGGPL
jgi:hypothetical protein